MRCEKKQCYLESLWTFRYNKDIAPEKTLKSGEKKRSNYGYYCKDFRGTRNP